MGRLQTFKGGSETFEISAQSRGFVVRECYAAINSAKRSRLAKPYNDNVLDTFSSGDYQPLFVI